MLFGSTNTSLGRAISSHINESSYKYSLDSNLAQVIEQMENEVVLLGEESSYKCDEVRDEYNSHLTNHSNLQLNAETVDNALVSFTETTGIPIVVVVDEIEDVFGRTLTTETIFTVVISIAFIVIAIVLIVKAVKGSKNTTQNNQNTNRYSSSNNNSSNNSSQNSGSDDTYW